MSTDVTKSGRPDGQQSKWRRRAAILGVVLALVCHLLPPDYRAVCETLASVCAGGIK